MASGDARPIPRKNVAFRVTFPIHDADGDLVTGAAGLDSEISKDGGTFADCTNEATEIATSSGMYFLDITATEMNADTVAIIVKTSTSGAKTTPIVLYPEEAGDIRVDAVQWAGAATATTDSALLSGDELADAVLDRPITEPTGVFAWPASIRKVMQWTGVLTRNKRTQTATLAAVRNDADSANLATSTTGTDGTTVTLGEWT